MTTPKSRSNPVATAPTEKIGSYVPSETDAVEINERHQALMECVAIFAAESEPKAVQIGERLEKIKKAVGHGHFEKWGEKHLTFDMRTARRYMARAKAKRTGLSDLTPCAGLICSTQTFTGGSSGCQGRKGALKLFSTAAVKILNLPVATISADDKITILRDYERLEPIALQLREHPSIFALTWQKKLSEPPVRWARKDVALFKAEITKAHQVLAALEADSEFDVGPAVTSALLDSPAPQEGDAP